MNGNHADMREDAKKDPDRLEREIDEQRREINETLSALEEKFSSRELAGYLTHYIGGPGREWVGSLGSSLRANPIPAMLTAIGLAWLMMSDRHAAQRGPYAYAAGDYGDYEGEGRGMFEGATDSAHDAADTLRAKAGELGDKVAHAGEALGERTAHAREAWRRRKQHAREGLSHSRIAARDNFAHMASEQPLALGAVGIALGALLGAALPRTEREARVMGRASRQVRERGRTMAREGYEKAASKASELAETAEEALQRRADGSARDTGNTQPGNTTMSQPYAGG